MLFLACFSVIFNRFLPAKRRSISEIGYDFGKFVMFSIFESFILFFPKHSYSRVFFYVIQEEIMQIGKVRTL